MRIVLSKLVVCLVAVSAAAQDAVQWSTDLEAAKAEARQSGRLVLVHFWTPDCKPCAALEQDVFNQPQVGVAMHQAYVPVKMNALELRTVADTLKVTRVPTDVILTPDGQVIDRSISPNSPMAYIAHLTKVASNHKTGAGTAFDAAVANAPFKVPNEAYANLNIPNNGADTAGSPSPAPTTSPAPEAVANPYAAEPPAQAAPQAAAEAPAVATAAGPVSTGHTQVNANPAVGDRYAMNNSVTSTTTMNPYATAASSQGTMPTADAPQSATAPCAASCGDSEACSNCASCDAKPGSTPAAAQPAQTVALPTLPPGAAPLGFDGFCPVTMKRQWQWAQGDIRYGAEHRGRTYLFVSQTCQQEFLANPDAYSPVLSGMDPVLHLEQAQSVPGKRQYALEYKGQFYLFSNEQTLNRFWQNAEQYTAGVQQAMQAGHGRIVR
jgi:YHS domain-containing protein